MKRPAWKHRSRIRLVVAVLGLGIAVLFMHASTCAPASHAGPTAASHSTNPVSVSDAQPGPGAAEEECAHAHHHVISEVLPSTPVPDQMLLGLALLVLATLPLWPFDELRRVVRVVPRISPPVPLSGRVLLRRVCVSRT